MVNKSLTETKAYSAVDVREEHIKKVLTEVMEALDARGYNAVNQIAGYLISNDPAYISSYKGARTLIQSVERYELLEELVRYYLKNEK